MFNLFSDRPARQNDRKQNPARQATIDFYNQKIAWLKSAHHPTPLLIITCRDIPPAALGGVTASEPKPFIKKALQYYEKKLKELA